MAEGFAEGSGVHDETSCDADGQENKEYEIEDVDNDANRFKSGEGMRLHS